MRNEKINNQAKYKQLHAYILYIRATKLSPLNIKTGIKTKKNLIYYCRH